jgi:tyrosyl-tRNA synthetase
MQLKKRLAFTLVSEFHDPAAAQQAQERFEREVQHKELPAEIPEVALPRAGDWPIVDLLLALNLATSKSDAKRLVEQGSVSLDGAKVTDPRALVPVHPGLVVRGRRRQFARIVFPTTVGKPS